MIVFDIETKPRPDLVRRFIEPYPAFNPDEVKYGNTKDPVKRAELLATKEAEHKAGEVTYWKNAEERAALNPLTAEVLCVGLLVEGDLYILGQNVCGCVDERGVLIQFWDTFRAGSNAGEKFLFWSGNGNPATNFDVDMLVRRSWILGVEVPPSVFNGRFLSSKIEDAAARYLMYQREAFCCLSRAADELGLFQPGCDFTPKGEADLVTGENFHLWWEGKAGNLVAPEEQQKLAVKYLTNDLRLLEAIANRLGYADVPLATA